MIDAGDVDSAPPPVRLAHVTDFPLGAAHVRPSVREVELGGRVERLEPRVMQALVALAEADGAVVTRDHLIARCWGGVVVGEDAINRVMVKIRRLSEVDENRSFTLETIPRVGYRLRETPPPPPVAPLQTFGRTARALAERRWLVFAAVKAVVIACVLVWLALSGRAKLYEIESVEMIAQSRRMEAQPALSPDGRVIVYTAASDKSEQTDLFMRDLSGGEEVQLTDTPDDEIAPVFSPQGDRLAYVLLPRSDPHGPCRIMVRSLRSGLDRQVGACEATRWVSRLAWTGDGRALIYNDENRDRPGSPEEIRILDLQSGEAAPLVPPADSGVGDFNTSVSPDGRRLAFVRHRSGPRGVSDAYVFELATKKLVRITHGEPVLHVAWAPDSRSLFVIADHTRKTELSLHSIDGRELRRYVLGPSFIYRPFAASGLLAFERHSLAENLVRASASAAAAITNGNQVDYGADFSHDGVLAFLSGQSEIWLYLQGPGEEPRRLAALTELMPRGLRWSPDGREIVFEGTERGRPGLFIVDAHSGAVRRVPLHIDEEPANPSWSADGRSLIFTGSSPAGLRLLRLDLASGGPPEPLTDYGWAEGIETEDGLFARGLEGPGVWRIENGRPVEQVLPELDMALDPVTSRASTREWAIAGGYVYGVDWKNEESASVIARPLQGGEAVVVAPAGPQFRGSLAVDPRTGEVVYAKAVDEQIDVGVMRLREG